MSLIKLTIRGVQQRVRTSTFMIDINYFICVTITIRHSGTIISHNQKK